jgi:hypothetical protein
VDHHNGDDTLDGADRNPALLVINYGVDKGDVKRIVEDVPGRFEINRVFLRLLSFLAGSHSNLSIACTYSLVHTIPDVKRDGTACR